MNKGQVVCGCFNITIDDLENQIKKGNTEFETVQDEIKVGTGCQKCTESVRELFYKLLEL